MNKSFVLKVSAIALLGLCLTTPAVSAQVVVQRRPAVNSQVVVRSRVVAPPPVVVRTYVPVQSYAPWGWYGYYGTAWGYPAYPAYEVRPATGEVKIDTQMKDASLYVDGGFVGPVGKFKKFSLSPGNHKIELRDGSGDRLLSRRVQVLVGKTIKLRLES